MSTCYIISCVFEIFHQYLFKTFNEEPENHLPSECPWGWSTSTGLAAARR